MTNTKETFFETNLILKEFKEYLKENIDFDVVTIVGEGEPTLYKNIKELILELKQLTQKPIAVITNGSFLNEEEVRNSLLDADIVLPSLDAYDEESFRKIDRPYKKIKFDEIYNGLIDFSKIYKGQLWVETMIIKDMNDDEESLLKFKNILKPIEYDRLYINTPVRPPAEGWVEMASEDSIKKAVEILGGISIDMLGTQGFFSEEEDDYEAVLSIIRRHPMNQYEVESFLKSRDCKNIKDIFDQFKEDERISIVNYKGYNTYRCQ